MSNPIWSFLTSAFQPLTRLIDDVHTSEEEKLQIKQQVFEAQNHVTLKLLDYEKQLLDSKTQIIVAEAQGGSWLQKSWRPITMLTFLVLVVCDAFGWLAFRLSEQAWALLQLGLSGYVVGRSMEKIAPNIATIFKKEKQ